MLGLLYGSGLKVGEACALRWKDIDPERGILTAGDSARQQRREIPVPAALRPVLRLGVSQCGSESPVFPGRTTGSALSTRMAEWIVQRAVTAAGIGRIVTGMTLRHSYARHCLEQGMTLPQLQELLGHARIETTMLYGQLVPNWNVVSPLDTLPADATTAQPAEVLRLDDPLPTEHLVLPFEPEETTWDRTRAFCHAMKLWLRGRFLAIRAGPKSAPPS